MVTLLDLFAVRLANSKSITIPGWHDGGLKQWPGETGNAPTAPSPISGPGAKSSGNLLWSIYLHDSHIRHSAAPDNRPMVMPRYGWLGQHRYCCGFSGDQTSEWETLQAEVAMTANSANVAFAHWSHDVSAGVPFLFFEGQASRSGRCTDRRLSRRPDARAVPALDAVRSPVSDVPVARHERQQPRLLVAGVCLGVPADQAVLGFAAGPRAISLHGGSLGSRHGRGGGAQPVPRLARRRGGVHAAADRVHARPRHPGAAGRR